MGRKEESLGCTLEHVPTPPLWRPRVRSFRLLSNPLDCISNLPISLLSGGPTREVQSQIHTRPDPHVRFPTHKGLLNPVVFDYGW